MGRGDKKSRRGKIANRSYGARRPKKIKRRPTVEEKISLKKKK
ncbi:RPS31 30S ribosomal protein S31 [Zobellia uliginosa]|uniref:RPS31 30S ribosomal protein S31 n=1 Tax=Zobellia uliginosa TaxID=143224 RepID=A0ABY1KZ10_9FLAO|nr:30S ribosomal protein THX [Zobellia uliginosa]SIS95576.1 RPS31 30S ribosomal protein S31 [Zobellia uliginosa]